MAPVPRDPARRRDLVLNALQTVLTAVIITGFVGRYGAAALAGYGVGLRLELLQIPLVFAVGQALVVLVGTHIGAGRPERAKEIAWVGAALRGVDLPRDRRSRSRISARLGRALQQPTPRCSMPARATCAPWRRSTLARRGHRALFRFAGRRGVLPPMLAGTARLALVIAGGLVAVSLQGVFTVIAAAMIAFGALTMWFVAAHSGNDDERVDLRTAGRRDRPRGRAAARDRREAADRRRRALRRRAQYRLRARRARRLGSLGKCTAIGHARALDSAGAAFVNGTAAHGEDFDDTFEGGPVHAGAVIVPAVLRSASAKKLPGKNALRGIAVGVELTCRGSLVAPKLIHKAGFHPTAVLGAMGAAAAAATALNFTRTEFVNALGIAGSMASGIIEYLAEGTWTKRMHPGWAAQSGIRAADLARAGFVGPRTVFEGEHGFFHGFARTTDGDWDRLLDGFGKRWVTETIAFKLYPCGTMTHPYIDCARRLSRKN